MRTKALLVVLVLLAASVGVFATACPTATYQTYLAPNFSCTIGDKTFSDFGYADSGTLGLTASEITVTPTQFANNYGFNFTAIWSSFAGLTTDSNISYTVTAAPGFVIDDATLTIQGFGASGPAQVSVADTFSNGSNLFVFFNPVCNASHTCVTTDHTTFAGVSSLDVFKDIGIVTGATGSGHLSFVSNTVSQPVPEPASLILFGSGLIGLAGLTRKKLFGKKA